MDNFSALHIDTTPTPTPVEPDHEAIRFDLYRHNLMARQFPNYLGSAIHVGIRERLSKNGVNIS